MFVSGHDKGDKTAFNGNGYLMRIIISCAPTFISKNGERKIDVQIRIRIYYKIIDTPTR